MSTWLNSPQGTVSIHSIVLLSRANSDGGAAVPDNDQASNILYDKREANIGDSEALEVCQLGKGAELIV